MRQPDWQSADPHPGVGEEGIVRHGEIEWRWALADAPGGVVDRAVAGTEPALVLALVPKRHAAQMRADSDHDQPFRLLDAGLIRLWISQIAQWNVCRILDFLLRTVANEHGSAAPFDRDDLTFGDCADIDLGRGHCERRGVGAHLVDQRPGERADADRSDRACGEKEEIPAIW